MTSSSSAPQANFRPARQADVPMLVELARRYYGEDGYPFDSAANRRAIEGLLADPRWGRLFAADLNRDVVGYLAVTFGYSLEFHGVDAFIDELYLVPAVRGQGLGRRAVELASELCRAEGVHALHLEVEKDKPGAQHLYRDLGFVDHDRHLWTLELGARRRKS